MCAGTVSTAVEHIKAVRTLMILVRLCEHVSSLTVSVAVAADSGLAWDVSYTSFAHPASQSASVGES